MLIKFIRLKIFICKKAKSRTPNFDLEKNLKMISDTVDKDFYDNFLSAVKSACLKYP